MGNVLIQLSSLFYFSLGVAGEGGDMRNGRGTCNDLLKACYDVVCMLRINMKLEIYQKRAG